MRWRINKMLCNNVTQPSMHEYSESDKWNLRARHEHGVRISLIHLQSTHRSARLCSTQYINRVNRDIGLAFFLPLPLFYAVRLGLQVCLMRRGQRE